MRQSTLSTEMPKLLENLAAIRLDLGLNLILDRIVENLVTRFHIETCTIGLFDPLKTKLDFCAFHGIEGPVTRYMHDIPKDLRERTLGSHEPINFPDLDQVPTLKSILIHPGLKSFLIVPLWGKTGVLGVITMGSKRALEFSAEQIALLTVVGDLAAIAIEKSELHRQAEERAADFEALNSTALAIAWSHDSQDPLLEMLRLATEYLRADGGGIYIGSSGGVQVKLEAAYGLGESLRGIVMGRAGGVVGKVLKSGAVETITEYNKWAQRRKQLDRFGVTSVIGVPLNVKNADAVLVIHSCKAGRTFGERDVEMLGRLAPYVAAAIARVRSTS